VFFNDNSTEEPSAIEDLLESLKIEALPVAPATSATPATSAASSSAEPKVSKKKKKRLVGIAAKSAASKAKASESKGTLRRSAILPWGGCEIVDINNDGTFGEFSIFRPGQRIWSSPLVVKHVLIRFLQSHESPRRDYRTDYRGFRLSR
jgi:hypothetical protein